LSFFIPSVFMLFCLISLHYVNGINKVMMMMMMKEQFRHHNSYLLVLSCPRSQLTADDSLTGTGYHERLCVKASHTLLLILRKSLSFNRKLFFQDYQPWSLFTPPTPS